MQPDLSRRLREAIRDIPDFPQPGVLFRDVTTLLLRPDLLSEAIDALWAAVGNAPVSHVVAIEARGFVLGAGLAVRRRLPLVLLRKPGKLPFRRTGEDYELEYGRARLEIHEDALGKDDSALIVDDVLATGGTAAAAGRLVRRCGATLAGYAFLAEIEILQGRSKLTDAPVSSLVRYAPDGGAP